MVTPARLGLSIAAALVLVGGPAGRPAARPVGGDIRGHVQVPNRAAPLMDHRPGIADLGAATTRPPLDRGHAVVYLESAPRQAFDELPQGRARMDQRGEQFLPHVLAITIGTIVDFPNSDAEFHNVFSLEKSNPFNLGRYPKGQSRSVQFSKPGIVPVSCDIHRHMSAYILVFGHSFFAMTDDDGRYTMPNVPAGTYVLRVWSEFGVAEPRRVTVAENALAEADFQVGRQHP